MANKFLLLIFIFICMPLVGCFYVDRKPELPDLPMPGEEVATVETWYKTTVPAIQSFRILYNVHQSNPRTSFRYAAVYAAPDSFRLEIFPDQGFYSLGLFVSAQDRVLFIDQNSKKVISGSDPVQLFEELFGLPVPPEEVPLILMGRLPERVFHDSEIQWYRLQNGDFGLATDSLSEYWEIDGKTGMMRRSQVRDPLSGRLYVELHYIGSTSSNNGQLPQAIRIEAPLVDFQTELTATTTKMNTDIDPALFEPAIPTSYQWEYR